MHPKKLFPAQSSELLNKRWVFASRGEAPSPVDESLVATSKTEILRGLTGDVNQRVQALNTYYTERIEPSVGINEATKTSLRALIAEQLDTIETQDEGLKRDITNLRGKMAQKATGMMEKISTSWSVIVDAIPNFKELSEKGITGAPGDLWKKVSRSFKLLMAIFTGKGAIDIGRNTPPVVPPANPSANPEAEQLATRTSLNSVTVGIFADGIQPLNIAGTEWRVKFTDSNLIVGKTESNAFVNKTGSDVDALPFVKYLNNPGNKASMDAIMTGALGSANVKRAQLAGKLIAVQKLSPDKNVAELLVKEKNASPANPNYLDTLLAETDINKIATRLNPPVPANTAAAPEATPAPEGSLKRKLSNVTIISTETDYEPGFLTFQMPSGGTPPGADIWKLSPDGNTVQKKNIQGKFEKAESGNLAVVDFIKNIASVLFTKIKMENGENEQGQRVAILSSLINFQKTSTDPNILNTMVDNWDIYAVGLTAAKILDDLQRHPETIATKIQEGIREREQILTKAKENLTKSITDLRSTISEQWGKVAADVRTTKVGLYNAITADLETTLRVMNGEKNLNACIRVFTDNMILLNQKLFMPKEDQIALFSNGSDIPQSLWQLKNTMSDFGRKEFVQTIAVP
jgi:hypothetical protein